MSGGTEGEAVINAAAAVAPQKNSGSCSSAPRKRGGNFSAVRQETRPAAVSSITEEQDKKTNRLRPAAVRSIGEQQDPRPSASSGTLVGEVDRVQVILPGEVGPRLKHSGASGGKVRGRNPAGESTVVRGIANPSPSLPGVKFFMPTFSGKHRNFSTYKNQALIFAPIQRNLARFLFAKRTSPLCTP